MLKTFLAALTLAVATAGLSTAAEPRASHGTETATAADFVADVVGPYLAIQSALVKDDLKPIPAAARSLQKNAERLGGDGKALMDAAGKTADARTLEAAREAFGDLSTALIAYADTTKQPIEGKIVAFCPMVNKSWVQADGAIANPYYGKAMLTCGNSTRKLSAKH
jgi:hypothetical protein